MTDLYIELKKKSGGICYTLAQNKPAMMTVDDWKVTITYLTGRCLDIPRSMVTEAIHKLQTKGILTDEEVHGEITNRHGPTTDRLLAILRELPGVTFSSSPRVLFIKK